MQSRLLQLAVLFICLSGCIDRHTNTPAFYVWKNKLNAEDADTAYLNTLGVPKIYARIFDVDNKGNGTFPTADYSPSSPYVIALNKIGAGSSPSPTYNMQRGPYQKCPYNELKLRYGYLLVRLAHYMRNKNNEAIRIYNLYMKPLKQVLQASCARMQIFLIIT